MRFGPDGKAYVAYASLDWGDNLPGGDGDGTVDIAEIRTSVLVQVVTMPVNACVPSGGPSTVISETYDLGVDCDGNGNKDVFVFHDKPFVEADRLNNNAAYVSWTEFLFVDSQCSGTSASFQSNIAIRVRSTTNGGAAWGDPTGLPTGLGVARWLGAGAGGIGTAPLIQALDQRVLAFNSPLLDYRVIQLSYSATGPSASQDLIVCWYDSYEPIPYSWLFRDFEIRCRRSTNQGATFAPIFVAFHAGPSAPSVATAPSDPFPGTWTELDYWLGPAARFARLWGSMGPRPAIAPDGSYHIVLTAMPKTSEDSGEFRGARCGFTYAVSGPINANEDCGDILYVTSPAGGGIWSAATVLNLNAPNVPGPPAQYYPALAVQPDGTLHVTWLDGVASTTPGSNLHYQVSYRAHSEGAWTPALASLPQQVSLVRSIQDFLFIGDYTDLAVSASAAHPIWTDRRDRTSIFDFPDHVFTRRGT